MCIRNSGEAYVRLGGFNYSAVILPASGLGSLLWLLVVINIYSSPRVRSQQHAEISTKKAGERLVTTCKTKDYSQLLS